MKVYGNLINRIMESAAMPKPYIGMGATVCSFSDRSAWTVIAYVGDILTIQEDFAIRTDSDGMSDSQRYLYVANPEGRRYFYRWKDGRWRGARRNDKGRFVLCEGDNLSLGHRSAYHDFSF